jgi:nitrate/nitrite transport system substrate-binding protein
MNSMINKLPPAERSQLKLGYMRLSDSAPIIVAQELGLYSDYGLMSVCTEKSLGLISAIR